MIEQVSVNTLATHDFIEIRNRVKAIRESQENEDSVNLAERLEEVENLLNNLENQYHKRPSVFRKGLKDLFVQTRDLNAKVKTNQLSLQELEIRVSDLYLMRLADILGTYGKVDLTRLSKEERQMTKMFLDQTLRLQPDSKNQIREMFPGLIEYFYSQKSFSQDTEKEKDGDE